MQACKKKKKKKEEKKQEEEKENKNEEDLIFSHFIIYWDNVWWNVAVSSKKLHYFVRFFSDGIDVFMFKD
jgi:hypothetical protein